MTTVSSTESLTSNVEMGLSATDSERPKRTRRWTIQDAMEIYNIDGWGAGYFAVNDKGNLEMLPEGSGGPRIELLDIINEIQKKGIELPCLIRFHDILRHRVQQINEEFRKTIEELDYQGHYRGVYPIKVNQMREVVEEILDAGAPYHFGLEAGSKAELQVVLAYNKDPEALTICNGYKDSEYMRLALLGRQLGRKVLIVIEQFSELPLCLQLAEEVGVEPLIGFRAKLASRGAGKWETSGGENAKFGLSTTEILKGIELLKKKDLLHCLQLFHFHIGSQITDIRVIKEAVSEGARYYTSLRKLGVPIEYFDIGGGLGIDYDGSQSKSNFSINYTLSEYISDVVYNIQTICDNEDIPHPHIISESGRAIVAPHACLLMNVIDSLSQKEKPHLPDIHHSKEVLEAYEIYQNLNLRNALESFHDTIAKREQALSLFKLGHLSLKERAMIEQIADAILKWIERNMRRMKRIPDEFYELSQRTKSQYLVNFSVFQSAPDHWALDQLFPIVPIHRLQERPKAKCTLADITCDSDGEIDQFIDVDEDSSSHLSLHHLKDKQPYYLGMFLTGAYQDIMGDMHNLFGRVNEVHIFCDDDDPEDFYIEDVIRGDTISSTLTANQYNPSELTRSLKVAVDEQIRKGAIKSREGVRLIDFYEQVMQGYTYLRR